MLRRAAVQKILVKTDDNLQALVAAKVEGSRLLLRMLTKVSAQTKSCELVTIDYTTLNALNVSDGVRAEQWNLDLNANIDVVPLKVVVELVVVVEF